jgi:hypothetical protein
MLAVVPVRDVLALVARRGRRTTRRSLGAGDTRRAGRSARATHDAQVTRHGRLTTRRSLSAGDDDAQVARRGRRMTRRSPRCRRGGCSELRAFFVLAAMCSRSDDRRG